MGNAIRTRDLEHKKKHLEMKRTLAPHRDKTWKELSPEDKEDILRRLAIQAGLVKKEP